MYPDTKRIRENRFTVRLDTYELDLVKALANYKGDQISTLMRQIIVREALQTLNLDESVQRRAA